MRRYVYILAVVAVLWAWKDWSQRPVVHAAGVLVPEQPRQSDSDTAPPFTLEDYVVTPRAAFRIRARVLSRKDYWLGSEADLSPVDLALGWGPMSDQAVLDRIEISQSGRWYFTQYELPAPLANADIIRHSANMHLIPANDYVRSRLKDVREGDVIRIRGQLVDVDNAEGFTWRTSTRRDDTGGGSCEIIYVEQVQLEPRPG
jgi:hypothetical protein